MKPNAKPLSSQEVIVYERKLAKFANMMDSIVRVPFTKQGVGADAALSTIPLAGDIAGLILTGYAFVLGRKMGVPVSKMTPAVRLALVDLVVGIIPVVGTLVDIFIRPSRRTLDIVHDHIKDTYELPNDLHVDRPFLHESLQRRQADSAFWRNRVVSWFYLHIPDILGVMVLIMIGIGLYLGVSWILQVLG